MKLGPSLISSKYFSPDTTQFRNLFYIVFLFLNLIQAANTELFDDEAYYWVCSRYLDWGYFDHPPMIAFMIKIGTWLLPSELGVRFLTVVMSTGSIYLLEKFIIPSNRKLFYAIVLNIAIFQVGGILAVPDIPLFFFTVLFFIAYKNFLERNHIIDLIWMSFVISMMIYSKYHGLLILFFTILSNPGLLKKKETYFVFVISLILLIPHIVWQVNNGYPSVQYQLFERLTPPYKMSFTSDFLLGQLLIAGPLIGWLLIWTAFKYKSETVLEKALSYTLVGFYVIFFISSFFTRTEMNWTIPILAPLVYFSNKYLQQDQVNAKWIYKLLPISLMIVLFLRLFMATDLFPYAFLPKDEFHQNKKWAAEIKSYAGTLPVVFTNSYQRASKYWFYSGDTSFSLNTFRYRRNGFNLWPLDERLQKKKIMLIGSEDDKSMIDQFTSAKMNHSFTKIDSFFSNSQIIINASSLQIDESDSLHCKITIQNPQQLMKENANFEHFLSLILYPNDRSSPIVIKTNQMIHGDNYKINLSVLMPKLKDGQYNIRFGLDNSYPEPTINSRAYPLKVQKINL